MLRKLFNTCMSIFSWKGGKGVKWVGTDERGNRYFVKQMVGREQRTVEFKESKYVVTDIPMHWRMWLYHRLQLPPTEYTEKVQYIPPDISPNYDPYDERAQKMCLDYIEFLKPQILGKGKK